MKVLIIEDEEAIRDIIAFSIEIQNKVEILNACNGVEGIKLIEDNPDLDIVICDYNMPIKNGDEVFKYLVEKKSPIKYISCHGDSENKIQETVKNGKPFFHITKPDICEGIEELFKILPKSKDQPATPKARYIPVSINIIYKIGSCPGDLYITINEEKYIKIYNQGDTFGLNDFNKYKEKEITNLFIGEQDSKKVIQHFENSLKNLLADNKPGTVSENVNKLIKMNSLITSAVNTYNINPEVAELTKKSIEFTVETFKKNEVVQGLLSNVFNNEESYISQTSTISSYISCAIAGQLGWNSDENCYKLTLAAFLHDSTLENLQITDYETINNIEQGKSKIHFKLIEKYKLHPSEVINVIKQLKDIPPEIDKIILEHHERPDGSGFPRKLTYQNISAMGSILIISLDIADYLYLNRKNISNLKNEDIYNYINKPIYQVGNFKKIVAAVEKIKLF
ncbi:MAG: response regulator [Bacteriovoracaceae bacterium]